MLDDWKIAWPDGRVVYIKASTTAELNATAALLKDGEAWVDDIEGKTAADALDRINIELTARSLCR
jgi:hypothetical protein